MIVSPAIHFPDGRRCLSFALETINAAELVCPSNSCAIYPLIAEEEKVDGDDIITRRMAIPVVMAASDDLPDNESRALSGISVQCPDQFVRLNSDSVPQNQTQNHEDRHNFGICCLSKKCD